eukprot:CAMPEP_0172450072 /NCGR_PEP_ID=MMETSP1065-20121228/8579_1 /TAXON_ID=265537 /ORGANISM="Amphiprora paludosa, Strain CCMP125" /LENGTH=1191 /DNA_ID=CAMNT_0013201841 /DNA_START=110 /DNA_END=3685 /DNA_ORIENTATION=-
MALSAEDEESAERFRKMLKMGLPDSVVRHKMLSEGVEAHIQEAVFDEGGAEEAAPAAAEEDAGLTPEEEEQVERFQKMLKMGLPPTLVQQKMEGEEASEKVIATVLAPPPTEGDEGASTATPPVQEEDGVLQRQAAALSGGATPHSPGNEVAPAAPSPEESLEEEVIEVEEVTEVEEEEEMEQEEIMDDAEYENEMSGRNLALSSAGGDTQSHQDITERSGDMNNAPPPTQMYQPDQGQYEQTHQYQQQAPQEGGYYDNTTGQFIATGGNVEYDENEQFHEEYDRDLEQQGMINGQIMPGFHGTQPNDPTGGPAYIQDYNYDYAHGPPPEQAPLYLQRDPKEEQEEERARGRRRWLVCCLVLVMAIFAVALCGLGVVLGIWLSDREDGDTTIIVATPSPVTPRTQDGTPTAAPVTSMPTAMPPPGPISIPAVEQFTGPADSGHGTSVAASGDWIAISEPDLDSGLVKLFQRGASARRRLATETQTLTGPSTGSRFGADLDFSNVVANDPYLLVGAPEVFAGSTSIPAGAAYFYTYNRGDEQWVQEGSAISGGISTSNANEGFGTSVAQSDNYRVVVGAPGYGSDSEGRVYTFTFEQVGDTDAFDWEPLSDTSLLGSGVNASFGAAVDITSSGNTICAGEPGTSSFRIYDWDAGSATWVVSFDLNLPDAVDMGAEVKFLSSDHVAVGAPSASAGDGLILVFQRVSGTWGLLGQLNGMTGAALGAFGTFDGAVGPSGPELVVGTATGFVERYDWFNGEFVQRFSEDQGFPVTSIDVAPDGTYGVLVGFGGQSAATLLEASTPEPTPSPTPSPTPLPTLTAPQGSTGTFREAGGPFTIEGGAGLGTSVAWAGDLIAAGLSKYAGRLGAVQTYQLTVAVDELALVEDSALMSEEFGAAVAMRTELDSGNVAMLVGATDTNGEFQSVTAMGAAYYYVYTDGAWSQIGGEIRSDETLPEAGGKHGQSVALASTLRRIAVASPDSSVDKDNLDNGRVYTYEFDGTDWAQSATTLIGASPDDFMGTGLDISSDGTRLLVGSPGANSASGLVEYMELVSGEWQTFFSVDGSAGDMLGTSATIINSAGTEFAVGGPTRNVDGGVVRVFQQGVGNSFEQRGTDIEGASGESIGTSVCGRGGRIAVGTATGAVRVYEFVNGDWFLFADEISTGSGVKSCAMSDDGFSVAVGLESQEVRVYVFS